MANMIFTIIGLLIGIGIAVGGGIYLKKDWRDKESRKIYSIILVIGIAITLGLTIKIFIAGF
jgi:hypothetical protein